MIKVVIFDFDGVICDSVNIKTIAFKELYKEFGPTITDQVVTYHLNNGGISRHKKIKYFHNNLLGINISDSEINSIASKFADYVKNNVISSDYIPGVDIFINKLFDSFPLFICTGTPEVEMVEILHAKNIHNYFKGVYGSPKSKSEIIFNILSEMQIDPEEALFFGDTLTDFNAAVDTGINFIGIENKNVDFPKGVITIKDFNDKILTMNFKY